LHVLVNWAGELSLAHAAFIGLPALVVAQLSAHSGASPIVVLPVGVAAGAVLGLVVAVPALRARGLQVALVTLAVGIAIDRFFFVRSWVIGSSGGVRVPIPSLFGIRFETSRSLVPVLVVVVLVAVLVCRAILGSKVGRALSLVQANPDAAAAAGIPVAFYRSVVYMVAGGFAGLAGSSYVLWVQRVSPKAFPLQLGFTYLVIAVLAGKGGLAGLGLSAVLLEGGQVFSIIPHSIALYLGPIALVFNVTRYQEGFNGVLRELRLRSANQRGVPVMSVEREPIGVPVEEGDSARTSSGIRGTAIRLPVVVASVVVVAGFAAMALAWYHAGNTDQLWIQNQEIVSGGLGGLALIVLGSMLLVRDALIHGRGVVGRVGDLGQGDVEPAWSAPGALAPPAGPSVGVASPEVAVSAEPVGRRRRRGVVGRGDGGGGG
jgi:branched-chain amino acid transport system permease protein